MVNVYETLGVEPAADKKTIKASYHRLVKLYHPDQYRDELAQQEAQKKLIELNLAYEQAMKSVSLKPPALQKLSLEQAKLYARKSIQQGDAAGALRQLTRADGRDDGWYYLEGQVMMLMRQYGAAHQSFRKAIAINDAVPAYREAALKAAVRYKRDKNLVFHVVDRLRDALDKHVR